MQRRLERLQRRVAKGLAGALTRPPAPLATGAIA